MAGIAASIALLATTAASASGSGAAIDLGDVRATVRLTLTASVATGTLPTLDVSIETSTDPSAAEWRTVGAFAQIVATGGKDVECVGVEQWIRARWKIAGDTPSFTFAIAGRSVTAYTNRKLIEAMGVNDEAIAEVHNDDVVACARAASRDIDRLLWLRSTPLPEREVTGDIIRDASIVAGFHLMSVRGFDASKEDAKSIIDRYYDAMSRLAALDGGRKLPPFDTGPATTDTIQIATSTRRGWGQLVRS